MSGLCFHALRPGWEEGAGGAVTSPVWTHLSSASPGLLCHYIYHQFQADLFKLEMLSESEE